MTCKLHCGLLKSTVRGGTCFSVWPKMPGITMRITSEMWNVVNIIRTDASSLRSSLTWLNTESGLWTQEMLRTVQWRLELRPTWSAPLWPKKISRKCLTQPYWPACTTAALVNTEEGNKNINISKDRHRTRWRACQSRGGKGTAVWPKADLSCLWFSLSKWILWWHYPSLVSGDLSCSSTCTNVWFSIKRKPGRETYPDCWRESC